MNELASFLSKTKTARAWNRIGVRPHHGICVPLSSLRSSKNCGVGDFGDLPQLIDWCKSVGFDCIQLLPILDSGDDPSPYNPISSFALNPIYLNLGALPDARLDPVLFHPFASTRRLSYSRMRREKMRWLFKYYERCFSSVQNDPDYLLFLKKQHHWLDSYSLFMVFKEEYGGKQWKDWPEEKRSRGACKADPHALDFHRFVQYHCNSQMRSVKEYAEEKGILLMGDIPLLISPDSADVWSAPHLFDMLREAGAPPDYYNPSGQRWGFPLFNLDAMRNEDFAWWKERVRIAAQFFHLYRLDHFVGLFRIWSFSDDFSTEGAFVPADPSHWKARGEELLNAILSVSDMLPMAENLGIIPPIANQTMHRYGICGMTILRWQRRWDVDGSFIPYEKYPPLNLTSISTHDSETLEGWWKSQPSEASLFADFKHWTYEPELAQWQRKEILRDSHQTPTLFHINLLQEYLALFPELVSPQPEEERINIPGTIAPGNWTYRLRPSIEEIAIHQGLKEAIHEILRGK